MSTFEDLGIDKWLAESLNAMKIHTPTAIQKACIPKILNGKYYYSNIEKTNN